MSSGIISVFLPMLIHLLVSNTVTLLLGTSLDDTQLTTAAAVIVLPIFALMYQSDCKKSGEEPREKIPWWVFPLMAAAGVALNVAISAVMESFAVTEHFSNAAQEGLLGSGFLAQLIGLGFLVPLAEELLFRGLVYQRLKKYFPVRTAILLAAAVFALYHGNMVQILFAFPLALVMLLAYEKWRSLAVPVVFHMAVNLSTVMIHMAG